MACGTNEADRCCVEIAAIRERGALEPERWPAYLFVLGEMDWLREMEMILDSAGGADA